MYITAGSWRGRYRTYNAAGAPIKHFVTLGSVSELSAQDARKRLLETIRRDELQSGALIKIGSKGMVCPRASTRLKDNGRMVPAARGAISELMVAVDLTTKGYTVFRPIHGFAVCDLLAMDSDWTVLRIEVKTAPREPELRNVRVELKRQIGCFDLIAFVFTDGQIEYRKPSEITDLRFPFRVAKIKDVPIRTDSISDIGDVEKKEDIPA
jgi:hypothetical protein